ncbi:unnamed protein product [Ixodes hexagonus]
MAAFSPSAFYGQAYDSSDICSDRKVKGQRPETVFYCKTCTRHPGLHPGICFERYHMLRNYR